jgi:hypothetical protein
MPLRRVSRESHWLCNACEWLRLKQLAYSTGRTVYQLKYGLLSNYLIQQLKHPVIAMTLA